MQYLTCMTMQQQQKKNIQIVWEYAPSKWFGKLDALRLPLRSLLAQSGTTVIILICTSLYVWFQYVHIRIEILNFYLVSFQYWLYIGLLNMVQGYKIVRLDTRRPHYFMIMVSNRRLSWLGDCGSYAPMSYILWEQLPAMVPLVLPPMQCSCQSMIAWLLYFCVLLGTYRIIL